MKLNQEFTIDYFVSLYNNQTTIPSRLGVLFGVEDYINKNTVSKTEEICFKNLFDYKLYGVERRWVMKKNWKNGLI